MQQKLPYGGFQWLTNTEINDLNIEDFDADDDEGLIVECDLDYPEELFDMHKDYPLAPDSTSITKDMLSDITKQFLDDYKIPFNEQKRLTPNFLPKRNYIVHIKNLKYYIKKGLILKKVHRAISFKQSCWMKEYIDFNTQKRKNATSEFEKSFFKLLINAVFGKSLENVRRYRCIKVVGNSVSAQRYINKPQFKKFQIINSNLVCVELLKTDVKLNKPIYVGMVSYTKFIQI